MTIRFIALPQFLEAELTVLQQIGTIFPSEISRESEKEPMSFLLRAAFWLTVLAFLLPAAGFEITPKGASASTGGMQTATLEAGDLSATPDAKAQPDISATEALGLAARSAKDAMGFCDRNPDVCERSGAVINRVIRQGAYYGSRIFLWLTDKARSTTQQHENSEDSQGAPSAAPSSNEGVPAHRPRTASPA